jgi:hypothetical protein
MSELLAFLLPPATALVGMRLARLLIGEKFDAGFGFGLRFAIGFSLGMLVFSQAVLGGALAGFNASIVLAYVALLWGAVELVLLAIKLPAAAKLIKFQPGHSWLLLLIPLLYSWWVFGRLSTLEGTLGFDANAFWVFKSKILFLEQGKNLVDVLRQSDLGYAHMDYPMLVPCLYTLDYGAVGRVDEFVNKIWPFWMMVALCAGIISFARLWKNPRLLPIAVVTLIAFLPASLQFIRDEGGTIPMVFATCLAALLLVSTFYQENELAPAALVLALAACFSTKFEGAIFAVTVFFVVLLYCLRRGWFKNMAFWKCTVACAVCQIPYFFYRLSKPVANPESGWLHEGLAAPGAAAHCYPRVWFVEVFARFFSSDFFHWQTADEKLQWAGHWAGWNSLLNEQLSILPWLLVVLLAITIIYKVKGRIAILSLSGIILFVFSFLSLVVSCLYAKSLSDAVDFACNTVGRYYYPFFTAWFLGTAAIWFQTSQSQPALLPEKKATLTPTQKPKRKG